MRWGVPTFRSLTLFMSGGNRAAPLVFGGIPQLRTGRDGGQPCCHLHSRRAIVSTRVGQIELFARRVRSNAHPAARQELELIVRHLIDRNYIGEIDRNQPFANPGGGTGKTVPRTAHRTGG